MNLLTQHAWPSSFEGGGVNGYSSLVPLQGIRKWAHYVIIIFGRKSVNKLITSPIWGQIRTEITPL